MGIPNDSAVTRVLQECNGGDREALNKLIPLVHAELHRLARSYFAREKPGQTLQPTALVNEAYLRLANQRDMNWNDRSHVIAIAAQLMRFILVDHCRRKRYAKRGGGEVRVTFDENLKVASDRGAEMEALDSALKKLEAQDPRKSRIAELRFFGGLTVQETAQELSISEATVMRDWRIIKAWLQRELS